MLEKQPQKIVWFDPTAGIEEHAVLQRALIGELASAKDRVTVVRCRGILDSHCQVYEAKGIDASSRALRERTCRECRSVALQLDRGSGARVLYLDDLVPSERVSEIDAMLEATSDSELMNVQVEGLPIGRYCNYTTILKFKTSVFDGREEVKAHLRAELRSALIVQASMQSLIAVADGAGGVCYNAQYPINRVFFESFSQASLPCTSIHGGQHAELRHSTFHAWAAPAAYQEFPHSPLVRESMSMACSSMEISVVLSHVRQLMLGIDPFVYSPPRRHASASEVREALGIPPTVPTVVALVSSPDEYEASEQAGALHKRNRETGHTSDVLWLQSLLEVAVLMPDVVFVVRVHPRLAPNKRESVESPALGEMRNLLSECPGNVRVNWPEESLGLYDLMAVAAAALNHRSTAGLEFLLMGLPVALFDPDTLNAYPPELCELAPVADASGLRIAVTEALDQGWRYENMRDAFRWSATWLWRSVVSLGSRPPGISSWPIDELQQPVNGSFERMQLWSTVRRGLASSPGLGPTVKEIRRRRRIQRMLGQLSPGGHDLSRGHGSPGPLRSSSDRLQEYLATERATSDLDLEALDLQRAAVWMLRWGGYQDDSSLGRLVGLQGFAAT